MKTSIEKKLWERINKYSWVFELCPFVQMTAVCNNLSFGIANKNSDIDIFVITKKGRLFFARTFLTLLCQILGVRRHGNKINMRFCLSFFMDDEDLNLSKIALDEDYYLAMWTYSLVPLSSSPSFLNKFKLNNLWVMDFFPKGSVFFPNFNLTRSKNNIAKFFSRILTWFFGGILGRVIEFFLKKWQLKRSKIKSLKVKNKSGLIINEHMLKFHNIDRRQEYNSIYKKKNIVQHKINPLMFKSVINDKSRIR